MYISQKILARFQYEKIYSNIINTETSIFNLVASEIVLLSLYFQKFKNQINGINDNIIVNFSLSVISQSQFISKISIFLEILILLDILKSNHFFAL